MTFREAVEKRVLVFDGAMGTQIQGFDLKASDFGGKEGANDLLTLTRPDLVEAIHGRYFAAGCDVVETNTFGSSRLKLDEYGLGHRTYEVNFRAAILARRAADRHATPGQPRFVAGSMGPTGMLPSSSDPALSTITGDALEKIFFEQARALIDGGADAILIETQQDILELRAAVLGADAARREAARDVFLMAQPTLIDASGRMLLGTDVSAALATMERLPLDAVGINCSTGPAEMRESVRTLCQKSSHFVSVMPNAGLPENVNGRAVYKLSPEALAEALAQFAGDFGVDLVGGCCGTTPEHMRAVAERIRALKAPRRRRPRPLPELSSAMKAVPLDLEPRPLIVGERVNSQGSRKVKELLLADDYAGLLEIARGQVEGGAHVLDVCTALNEREDEAAQMRTLVRLLAQSVDAPLMIDSTEADVIESALKVYPGRCIVNSVNLEKGGERVRKVLPLVKRFGAAVVCMTIDEKGMAQTAERKAEIARRTVAVAREYGLEPDQLVFDALTFTLATGGAEYRHSAVETLDGIRRIKAENPGVFTTLGVSNVSFGLSKAAREVVNSVFLYHAVQAGLDLAIVNPKDVRPYPQILDEAERVLAEDLILDRREDALARLIAHFEGKTAPPAAATAEDARRGAERPRSASTSRSSTAGRRASRRLIDEALTRHGAGRGAERRAAPGHEGRGRPLRRGRAHPPLRAPVGRGDEAGGRVSREVPRPGRGHDQGQGRARHRLRRRARHRQEPRQDHPREQRLHGARPRQAGAGGDHHREGGRGRRRRHRPLGAARLHLEADALLRAGAGAARPLLPGAHRRRRHQPQASAYRTLFLADGSPYPGGVFYARDAFEGLELVEAAHRPGEARGAASAVVAKAAGPQRAAAEATPRHRATGRRAATVRPVEQPARAAVLGDAGRPGGRGHAPGRLAAPRSHRALQAAVGRPRQGQAEYDRMIREEFGPRLEALKAEVLAHGWLTPKVVYGYFPCHAEGERAGRSSTRRTAQGAPARLAFPRQPDERHLCLADYFRSEPGPTWSPSRW